MVEQPTSSLLQEKTSLSMLLPMALQNTNRITTFVRLGLFPTASTALSPTTLFLLWLLLAQTQQYITHPPAVS
jgi:hypothetical protein